LPIPTERGQRREAGKTLPTTSGGPRNQGHFVIENNEQTLAAYLGFNDVKQLRLLGMSWPFLNPFPNVWKLSAGKSKADSFSAIRDNEDGIMDTTASKTDSSLKEEWMEYDTDSPEEIKRKNSHHIAWNLVYLERFIKEMMSVNIPEENMKTHKSMVRR
jgi:hypothetical protein